MDRGGIETPQDQLTGAIVVLDSDHNYVHSGLGYSAATFTETVADDGYVYLEIKTPNVSNRYVHLKKWIGWTEGGVATIEIVESPTLTTGATAIVPQNRKRTGTPATSAVLVKSNPTSISGGTVIDGPTIFGGGGVLSGSGGNADGNIELVLGVNKTYLVRVKNLAGAAKALGIWVFWYEEEKGV